MAYITAEQLAGLAQPMRKNSYGRYLLELAESPNSPP
jgi:dTDP-glucose pyrophosphorylase